MKLEELQQLKPGTVLRGSLGIHRRSIDFVFSRIHNGGQLVVGRSVIFGSQDYTVVLPISRVKRPVKN